MAEGVRVERGREGGGGGSWPNTKKDILTRAQERELKAGL